MKKILSIVLAGLVLTLFCSLVLAEDKKESTMGKEMTPGGMTGRHGMMEHKQKMEPEHKRGMMMQSMMSKSLVATSDGGVVVMVGNKLLKYDKNLNLVKEAEIKMDFEGMKEMMEKCPMHKKMMEKGGMSGEGMEKSKKQ